MTQLKINDVPESTLAALQTKEVLWHPRGLNTVADSSELDVLRQKREMEDLVGSWDDSRSAAEIIANIEAARTAGHDVSL